MKNILIFVDGERRIAEFLTRPKEHVFVDTGVEGIEHELATRFFDSVKFDLVKLVSSGVKEIRIEVEG